MSESSSEPKRLYVTFIPQVPVSSKPGADLINVEQDSWAQIEVTSRVLNMSLEEIRALDNDTQESDDLVSGLHPWEGAFAVRCVDEISDFFDQCSLDDITEHDLHEARVKYGADTSKTRYAVHYERVQRGVAEVWAKSEEEAREMVMSRDALYYTRSGSAVISKIEFSK